MKNENISTNKIPTYKTILFTVFFILILFLCLEGVARIYLYFRAKKEKNVLDTLPMAIAHPTRIFELKPNYYQKYISPEFQTEIATNSDGLRDREHSIIKPQNTYRIVVLGDSMTFGWGVNQEETWWKFLEERLNNDKDFRNKYKNYEVINLGVWMYTYDQQLLRLEEKGLKYQPDLVIQDIYWPHLRTIANHKWEQAPNGKIIKISDPTFYVSEEGLLKNKDKNIIVNFLKKHSKVLNFVISRLQTLLLKNKLVVSDLCLLNKNSKEIYKEVWQKAFESIIETKELLKEKNIQYYIFLIPREVQVSSLEWEPLYSAVMNEELYKNDIPQTIFKTFFDSQGIQHIDLLPIFRENYSPDLYFPVDPHLTQKGHYLISEILYEALKDIIK